MKEPLHRQIKSLSKILFAFVFALIAMTGVMVYLLNHQDILTVSVDYESLSEEEIKSVTLDEETILQSGFINDEGVSLVIQNCTQCHSSKLVTQNRMSKEGWESTIAWMQETQNLWGLGTRKDPIVHYLAKNYGPESKGRRQNLTNIEWYKLK